MPFSPRFDGLDDAYFFPERRRELFRALRQSRRFFSMPSALLCNACVESKCVMGRGANWSRITSRKRMKRQGVEDVKGKMPLVAAEPPKQPRRKLSKAELR
jgi:hypothetical protein